ncbi:MAG TPA: hypothetical protein VIK10_11050 [Prolixibacteraceae bacterium]
MGSKRRYQPIGKYPIYSKEFDRLRMGSEILNPDSRPNIRTIFWDKDTLQAQIVKIIADFKPLAQAKLEALERKFQELQKDCRNQGKEIPTEMPVSLQNEKYKMEASQDVLEEELELIQERLKSYTDKVEKVKNEDMLRWGLQCRSKNHGFHQPNDKLVDVMAVLDGQRVSMCPEGLLIIDDEASIYNTMSVADYRKLSKIWHQDRINADAELLKIMQKTAKENGEEKPFATGRSMSSTVDKAGLPKFPAWAKHYSMSVIKEVEEEQPMKRLPKYSNSKAK